MKKGQKAKVRAIVRAGSYNGESHTLWARVSTRQVDRYNSIFLPTSFERHFPNFEANPVILWGHDHKKPAIGKAIAWEFHADGLDMKIQFAGHEDPEAARISRLYGGGYLNAFSVGGIIHALVGSWAKPEDKQALPVYAQEALRDFTADHVITEFELWEVSACNVPGNAGALQRAIDDGLLTAEQARSLEAHPGASEDLSAALFCEVMESLSEDLGALKRAFLEFREAFAPAPPSDPEVRTPELLTMTQAELCGICALTARAAVEAYQAGNYPRRSVEVTHR